MGAKLRLAGPPGWLECSAWGSFEGGLAVAVRRLKYGDQRRLAAPLGALLLETARGMCSRPWDVVVPVPTPLRRYLQRGFNPAWLLAEQVGLGLGLPVFGALRRSAAGRAQAGLGLEERRRNPRGLFEVAPRACPRLEGRRVLLLDDVCTTGATLVTCAEAIHASGATAVEGLVLARRLRHGDGGLATCL